MATADLTIVIAGRDEASKVLAGIQKQAGGLGKTLGDVGKIAAGFLAAQAISKGVGALSGFMQDAIEVGKGLELQNKKVTTVFAEQEAVVRQWAAGSAAAMGLSKNAAAGLAANFADLLIPMGFTREAAAGMSTDVVGLAGALSEWSNGSRTSAEVSQILAKAMLGERESLKELGISITEADVQTRLLEKGQKDLTGTQLQQAKATATQELIFEKSTDAQTAYANGADSAARKQAELTARSAELTEKIGTKLLPVSLLITRVKLALVGVLADKLLPAMASVGNFIKDKLSPIYDGLKSVVQGVIDVFNGDALESYSLQQGKLRDIVEAAQDVAEFFRDKLIPAVRDTAQAIKDVFAGNPLESYEQHSEGMRNFLRAVERVAFFIRDTLIPAFKSAIDFIVNDFGPKFLEVLGKVAAFLKDTFLPNFIEGLSVLKDAFSGAIDLIKPIIEGLADFIGEKQLIMIAAFAAIGVAFLLVFGPVGVIVAAVAGVIAAIGYVSSNWDELKAKAEEIFPGIGQFVTDAGVVITDVFNAIATAAAFVVEQIKTYWPEIRAVIGFVIDNVKTRIEGFIQQFEGIVQIVTGVVGTVKAIFEGDWAAAWEGMKTIASGVLDVLIGTIKTIFGNIPGIILGLAGQAASAAGEFAKSTVNAILNWFESLPGKLLQAGKDAMNGFIEGLKSVPVVGTAIGIGEEIIGGFKSVFKWGSPSKVMHGYGQDTMQGFINGMESTVPALQNTLRAVTDLVSGFGGSVANQALLAMNLATNPGAGVHLQQTRTSEFGTITAVEAAKFILGGLGEHVGRGLAGVTQTILEQTGKFVGSFEDLQAFLGTALPGTGSTVIGNAVSGVQNIMETVFSNYIGAGFTAWQATVAANLTTMATQLYRAANTNFGGGAFLSETTGIAKRSDGQYFVSGTFGERDITNEQVEALRGSGWSFDSGGIVPGRRGSPQLIMAHGGETVLPTHKNGMGAPTIIVNVYGSVLNGKREIVEAVKEALRGGGFSGLIAPA